MDGGDWWKWMENGAMVGLDRILAEKADNTCCFTMINNKYKNHVFVIWTETRKYCQVNM